MPTYRLTLEYEGTRYRGWQEQQNARSVAGELRRALEDAGSGVIKELGGSGRTDAGVHALAQVAHLRLAKTIEPAAFLRQLNDALPPDIHVLELTPAGDRFHARHDALSRTYLYQLSRRRTALAKRWVWWVKRPLDLARMRQGAALLAGRHDYRLFCERPNEQTSTTVVVDACEIVEEGSLLLFRLTASHFLWKMVRRVVGTLVQLGGGQLRPQDFAMMMNGRVPPAEAGLPAEWTAPPSGLFLERVRYEGDPALPPLRSAIPVS